RELRAGWMAGESPTHVEFGIRDSWLENFRRMAIVTDGGGDKVFATVRGNLAGGSLSRLGLGPRRCGGLVAGRCQDNNRGKARDSSRHTHTSPPRVADRKQELST